MDNQALAILAAIVLFGALMIGIVINRDMGGTVSLASMVTPQVSQQSVNSLVTPAQNAAASQSAAASN